MARLTDYIPAEAVDRVLSTEAVQHRLPGRVFRDPGYLALELDGWIARTWLFVGRMADLPAVGDARTAPGLPIFVVKSAPDRVRAFHNACRHRGHRLIAEPCHRLKKIVCPYHHWTYELDGRLALTPNAAGARRHDLEGLDRSAHSLVPVRCETWHDWIFINLDGGAPRLEEFVAPLADKISFVDFSRLRHFLTMERREIGANWKICMENTMEPYHVPVVHASSAEGQPLELHYMVDDDPVVGSALDIPGSEYTNRPPREPSSPDNLDMSARYLLRMPNFFLTTYAPDMVVDTMIVPDGKDPRKCWFEQAWYTTSGREPDAAYIEEWSRLEEQVMAEDVMVMTEVQAGVESSAVDDGGVLTPAWESCLATFYKHIVRQLHRA